MDVTNAVISSPLRFLRPREAEEGNLTLQEKKVNYLLDKLLIMNS